MILVVTVLAHALLNGMRLGRQVTYHGMSRTLTGEQF